MPSSSILAICAALALCVAPAPGDRAAAGRASQPSPESPAGARKSRGVSAQAGAASDDDAGASGSRSALRVERFVICDEPPQGSDGDGDSDGDPTCGRALGAVEWRRMAREEGMQIECEMLFARAGRGATCQRVLHVEELCRDRSRLVWRELGDASGRSVLAEWGADGESLHTVDWGKVETLREEISASRGAVMPLYLIEMLREGRITSGRQLVFDPLTRALSELEIRTSYADAAQPPCPAGPTASWASRGLSLARCVELRRSDGTLAGRYRFRGCDLIAFQRQEGGAWACRVGAREHSAAVAQLSRTVAKDP
jgi:hypothetical protein